MSIEKKHLNKQMQPDKHEKPGKAKVSVQILMIAITGFLALCLAVMLIFRTDLLPSFLGDSTAEKAAKIIYQGGENRFAPDEAMEPAETVDYRDFVGSEQCALCHTEQYNLWRNSTHGRAGGDPGTVKIIAKFHDQQLKFKDALVIPAMLDEENYGFRVRQNASEHLIPVSAVVGGGHMEGGGTQSFFTKFPDGTLRFLPFDFSKKNDLWFAQLRKNMHWEPVSETTSLNDLAQWPPFRILGTQDKFSNCQNCHGSQILVEYDQKENQYTTRYTTLQINCESCHGPGRKHIELVNSAGSDTLSDLGIISFYLLDKDGSLNRCFECHAEKTALRNDFLPGKQFVDYYSLKFPILAGPHFEPDGRIEDFAYQQNHVFSDCYINGSMTCVDCHEPHSLMYRDVFWKPLPGKFDDGQCTGCHASKARNPMKHSHHKKDSPGNVCTACHMPFLQHRLIGSSIQFARSDHTIPIPRPAFDAQLGIENACEKCHWDKDLDWQQKKTEKWWGELKPHNLQIADNMKAKEVKTIDEAADLLLHPEINHPVAQIAGLFDFIKRFLQPDMNSLAPGIVKKFQHLAEKQDIDLQALALVALHLSRGQNPEMQAFLINRLKNAGNYETALRTRWAFAMDYLGLLYSRKKNYAWARIAHQRALEIKPGDSYTLANLAMAYHYLGNNSEAIILLKEAVRLDPTRGFNYFQLAYLYSLSDQKEQAIDALKAGLKYEPENLRAQQMLRQLQR